MNRDAQQLKVTINRCPHCDAGVKADPLVLFGDLDCPECSAKLWFLTTADSARFFDHTASEGLRDQALAIIAQRFEVDQTQLANDPTMINELDNDSLEALELLMELEEELGFD